MYRRGLHEINSPLNRSIILPIPNIEHISSSWLTYDTFKRSEQWSHISKSQNIEQADLYRQSDASLIINVTRKLAFPDKPNVYYDRYVQRIVAQICI